MFKNWFKNIKDSFNVMKNSSKETTKGFKGMYEEFKEFDFKKMPKKGFIFIGVAVVMFIAFMILAWFATRG